MEARIGWQLSGRKIGGFNLKIFVTGSTGQVGFELLRSLSPLGKIIAPTRAELDLMDLDAVSRFLEQHKPDLIVNAAAWTAVDAAEEQKEAAFKLNADLPRLLAHYSRQNYIWLVHYSSDYVYPGTGSDTWKESDTTGPLSVYGESKLAGDAAIIDTCERYLIFRTSWVYSARGNNFMKTMLRLARERESLSIVNDQIGSPTPARLIAEITLLTVCKAIHNNNVTAGVYHLAPKGQISWFDFADSIFKLAAVHGVSLKIEPSQLKGISTQEYPTPAKRPLNSRMDVSAIEAELSVVLPDWKSQLELTLKEYLD